MTTTTEKKKRMKPIYLIFQIGPTLDWTSISFTDKPRDPSSYTRGEGQCMIFKLKTWDYSTEFHKAVEDGRFLQDFGQRTFPVKMTRK